MAGPTAPDAPKVELTRISSVELPPETDRVSTGVPGLDACLAESEDAPQGLPLGTSVLLSGAPGGGKSTIAAFMAAFAKEALILSGEEKFSSTRKRWDRFNLQKHGDPWIVPLKAHDHALQAIRDAMPRLVVVDSVQCLLVEGSRRYSAQLEAAEMLVGQACGSGATVVLVCHVDKSGQSHAGAMGLAHLVDVHVHVGLNAKKSERTLEVRKNRCGRAGFKVDLAIGANAITCGQPAPIGNGLGGARTQLEQAMEKAYEMLVQGQEVNGYTSLTEGMTEFRPGMWRAGVEMAVQRINRDLKQGSNPLIIGASMDEFKNSKGRLTYRLLNIPKPIAEEPEPGQADDPFELDMEAIPPVEAISEPSNPLDLEMD